MNYVRFFADQIIFIWFSVRPTFIDHMVYYGFFKVPYGVCQLCILTAIVSIL